MLRMNCAVCHWPMTPKLQWESAGYGCALWHCSDCQCDIAAKAPISKFRHGFEPSVSEDMSVEFTQSIISVLRDILADARPSALKTQLEEVLNDGE